MVRAISVSADETSRVLALAQAAQDASLGDSNDEEIDALREALECALDLLGLGLPEAREPGDDE